MAYLVIGVAMRNVLRIAIAAVALASLAACVAVPPSAVYVQPGVTVVAPAPYYGPGYWPHRHYYRGGWDRRW